MTISEHEIGRLRRIEEHLALDDPRLAAMLRSHRRSGRPPLDRSVSLAIALVIITMFAVLVLADGILTQQPVTIGCGIAALALVFTRFNTITRSA